jgi:integrase
MTDFRRGEIGSLTRESFDLEGEDAGVTVSAKAAKARRSRLAPLRAELVQELREHLKRIMPGVSVFPVPPHEHSAKMIRDDLAAARTMWLDASPTPKDREEREKTNFLLYQDHAGRFLDFHALRHTRGVWLFEHYKAHPREVQELMGVSSLGLVDRYTRSFRLTDKGIATRGPDLSAPPEANAQAKKASA